MKKHFSRKISGLAISVLLGISSNCFASTDVNADSTFIGEPADDGRGLGDGFEHSSGCSTAVGSDNFHQEGESFTAYGRNHGVAIGGAVESIGGETTAIGTQAKAKHPDAVIVGRYAYSSAPDTVVIGSRATVSGKNSIVLGINTSVNEDNVFSVSNRRVVITDGKDNTDAATMGQFTTEVTAARERIRNNLANKDFSNTDSSTKAGFNQVIKGDLDLAKATANKYTNDSIDKLKAQAETDATAKANAAYLAAKTDAAEHLANTNTELTKKQEEAKGRMEQNSAQSFSVARDNIKTYTDAMTNATVDYVKTYNDEIAKSKANIGLNNLNETGKEVVRELSKEGLAGSGIDATGDTIIISKPMSTKDISTNGNVDVKGYIHAGGDITGDNNFYLKQDSFVSGNSTVEKNLLVKGNIKVDGSSKIHGNSKIDGDSDIGGNSHVKGDFSVDGNTRLGNNKGKDKLNIYGKTQMHGDVTAGDNQEDKLIATASSEFKSDSTFDKNVHIKGNLETDGANQTHGSSTIGGNLNIGGGVMVGRNASIKGTAYIQGDVYGKSLNIEGKQYISKEGIDANSNRIANVSAGEISSESTDAMNGHQLYSTVEDFSKNGEQQIKQLDGALTQEITTVGAQSAAIANLHPQGYNKEDKVSVATAAGSYRSGCSGAAGVYYRPDEQSMISAAGSIGSDNNMTAVGFSKSFGQVATVENLSVKQIKSGLEKIISQMKAVL